MKFTTPTNTYDETIPSPLWLRAILFASTLAMFFGLIGPAIWGDDDVVGWVVWLYYPGMTIGVIAIVAISVWFRKLDIWVDDTYLAFGYGRFRKRFTFDQISGVESTPYSMMKYGGAGIRYARGGYRAWSVPFLQTGVEVKVLEGSKDRTYYISSRNAEALEAAIQQRLSTSR